MAAMAAASAAALFTICFQARLLLLLEEFRSTLVLYKLLLLLPLDLSSAVPFPMFARYYILLFGNTKCENPSPAAAAQVAAAVRVAATSKSRSSH